MLVVMLDVIENSDLSQWSKPSYLHITACVEAGQVQTAKWVGLKNELNERSSYETTQAVPHLKGRNHM